MLAGDRVLACHCTCDPACSNSVGLEDLDGPPPMRPWGSARPGDPREPGWLRDKRELQLERLMRSGQAVKGRPQAR